MKEGKKSIILLVIFFVILLIITCNKSRLKKNELNVSYNIEGINKLMIVAHPDDEIIWGGSQLLSDKYLVVCITCGSNSTRELEFEKVMEVTNDEYIMLGYPDIVDNKKNNWKEYRNLIKNDIDTILNFKEWDIIVTHNPDGEYGHFHHIITSLLVTQGVNDKEKLYYFGKYYEKRIIEKKYGIDDKIDETLLNKKKEIIDMYVSQKNYLTELEHIFEYEIWIPYNEWEN